MPAITSIRPNIQPVLRNVIPGRNMQKNPPTVSKIPIIIVITFIVISSIDSALMLVPLPAFTHYNTDAAAANAQAITASNAPALLSSPGNYFCFFHCIAFVYILGRI